MSRQLHLLLRSLNDRPALAEVPGKLGELMKPVYEELDAMKPGAMRDMVCASFCQAYGKPVASMVKDATSLPASLQEVK